MPDSDIVILVPASEWSDMTNDKGEIGTVFGQRLIAADVEWPMVAIRAK